MNSRPIFFGQHAGEGWTAATPGREYTRLRARRIAASSRKITPHRHWFAPLVQEEDQRRRFGVGYADEGVLDCSSVTARAAES
jgi:hypothetical protein